MRSNGNAMTMDENWREIDCELRSIAKRQRALDAEEAALLCVVAQQQIWRQFGCATMLEYLEMIFGYGPKVGHERVRVALAIESLPELREALANGEVSYSALRELTRVVTPDTQREWLDAVRDKSVRQVEDLVRTHRKGDLPTDPGDPDLKPRRLHFEVSTATDALLRQARQSLANERGRFIEDDEFLAAMAAALLEGGANDNDRGRAKFQVRVTTCDACSQTYFEGGGRKIAVTEADAARADCDAQRIGADERAAQDIPPKTRREVLHRDGGKCTVPRCRSARFIEVHHIVPRSEGGSHDASNLTALCDGHHKSLHEGTLMLSGLAPNISVRFANDPSPHVETHVGRHSPKLAPVVAIPHRPTMMTSDHVDPLLATPPADAATPAIRHVETPARATHMTLRHIETKPALGAIETPMTTTTLARASAIPHAEIRDAAIPHVEARPRTSDHLEPATAIPHVETPARATHVKPRHVETKPTLRGPVPRVETPATAEAEPSAYSVAVMRAEAKQALRQLGFSPAVSSKCVDSGLASRPAPITLEQLIRVALKCSR